jgi:hypothetical protein
VHLLIVVKVRPLLSDSMSAGPSLIPISREPRGIERDCARFGLSAFVHLGDLVHRTDTFVRWLPAVRNAPAPESAQRARTVLSGEPATIVGQPPCLYGCGLYPRHRRSRFMPGHSDQPAARRQFNDHWRMQRPKRRAALLPLARRRGRSLRLLDGGGQRPSRASPTLPPSKERGKKPRHKLTD